MRDMKQLQIWSAVVMGAAILGSAAASAGLEERGWIAMAAPALLALGLLVVDRLARSVPGGASMAWVARVMAVMVLVASAMVLALSPEDFTEWISVLGTSVWISIATAAYQGSARCCLPRWSIFKRGGS